MKRLRKSIVIWFQANAYVLQWLGYLLNVTAFIALALWLIKPNVRIAGNEIDFEALFTCLTAVAIGVNQIYRWLLTDAEFCPAYALALGYVNNFLEPAIIQLIENGEKQPSIIIYVPEDISELSQNNIDRIKAEIQNKNFSLSEIQLNLKQGRARDLLTIQQSNTRKVYFDFPNTLTSLLSYIDYKIGSDENQSAEKAKNKLTKKLIENFYTKVNELIDKKRLTKFVRFCDYNLSIPFK